MILLKRDYYSVVFPNTITSIGNYAFGGCTNLSTITIPTNIESIEYYAFSDCPNITTVIYNAKDYSTNIFNNNTSIKTVRFGNEVTRIPSAFRGCTALTSVYIPNSVNMIDDYAFAGCTELTNIAIPNSVETIDWSAFSGCTALKAIEISKDNPAYSSIDGVLFNKDATKLIIYPAGKIDSSYSIPEGITEIYATAFSDCINLSVITIPSTYVRNDYFALAPFFNSYNDLISLERIIVSDNNPTYTSIDGVLFDKKCTKLLLYPQAKTDTAYIIPNGITSIGQSAFAGSTALSSVTIPDSVESIEYASFSDSGIEEISIPKNIKRMGASIFRGCNKLKKATISEGIKAIPNETFTDCKNLKEINFPNSIEEIDSYSVYNTQWYDNQPDGVIYVGKVALCYKGEMPENTSIKIKEGTELLAASAFCYYHIVANEYENKYKDTLVSVELPSTIKRIDNQAFLDCQSLKSITIPNGLTSIGTRAFENCSSLTSIKIPDTIICIQPRAFANCVNLKDIYIPSTLTSIGKYSADSFANIASGASSNNDVFKNTAWYNSQPDGIVYAGKVAIGYKGEMPENTKLVIKEGTVSIAAQAFANLENLISVTIPDSVTEIGTGAFYGCENLSDIFIPDSVTSIGGGVSGGCEFRETEWFKTQPDGVVYAGKVAIGYKGEMPQDGKVTIKEGTIAIADFAFVHNGNLVSITIPSSVKKIGQHAFYNCSNLSNVSFSNGLQEIGTFAFGECNSLKEVRLPSTISKFGDAAIGFYCEPGGPGHCDGSLSTIPYMDFTISGYSNTATEKYAKDNGLNFISIGTQPEKTLILGDVNFDGKVSLIDAIQIQKQTLFMFEFDNNQKICGDVDKNGTINLLDSIYVQKFSLNILGNIAGIGKEII